MRDEYENGFFSLFLSWQSLHLLANWRISTLSYVHRSRTIFDIRWNFSKIIIGVFNSRLASDIPSLAWAVPALASACRDVAGRVDRLARDAANASVGHSVACGEDASAAVHSWGAAVDCDRCKAAAVGQDCVVNRLALAEALPVGIIVHRLIIKFTST